MTSGSTTSTLIGASLLLAMGCAPDEHKLAADKTGDLTYALAERTRPDIAEIEGCGKASLTAEQQRTLPRGPYLQQVSHDSALVLFTTTASGEQIVDVSLPDGTPVASVIAENDESARPAGAWQAVARLEGLEAATLYCYAIRGATGRAGFRTAPRAESTQPVRLLVFGDSGSGGEYQAAVRDQMFTVPFDFIVHTGDIAYDDGSLGQLEGQFFDVYAELTRSFATYVVAGNHDYGTASGAPTREVFALPENAGRPEGLERWYSFDWGNAHVVGLDTERMDAVQAAWLDADLAATDKPWKIVVGHRPPYSSGEHGSNTRFREYFAGPIEKHGVQLVLNGHDHDYERSKPIAGTTYIVTGGGGRNTRPVSTSSFTAFSVDAHHIVQIEIDDAQLLLHAIDGVGREFDSARIELTGG